MTWDLRLNPATRDLEAGTVNGPDEILQRLITRLKRELGEWFLNTKAGLPWYQNGQGILGSKASSKRAVDLLIRRETLGTAGVERIIKLNTLFSAGATSVGATSVGATSVGASFAEHNPPKQAGPKQTPPKQAGPNEAGLG